MVVVDPDLTPDVRHVACIGLMGSGKSTVGRIVAERLGLGLRRRGRADRDVHRVLGGRALGARRRGGVPAPREVDRDRRPRARSTTACWPHPAASCSTARRSNAIESNDVVAVYLRAGPEVLAERIAHDGGHAAAPGRRPPRRGDAGHVRGPRPHLPGPGRQRRRGRRHDARPGRHRGAAPAGGLGAATGHRADRARGRPA